MTGAAAEAAKRLDAALAKQHSAINDADEQLADAVLKASSSSAEGKRRLQALQQDIIDEVDKLGPTLDTATGQQQMAEFLQGKTNDILNVVKNASLDSDSQAAVLDGLAARYAAVKDKSPAGGGGAGNSPGDAKGGAPSATGGGQTGTAGTGTGEGATDPMLGGLPSDPLMSALMPAMGALGGLPAAMGSMLPGFGGGGGLGGGLPLGDLGSAIGGLHDADNHHHDDADTKPDEHADPLKDRAGDDKPQNTQPAALSDPDKSGTQNAGAGGAPPAAAAAASGPQGQPTQVVLPDNSVRAAATPALAQAARAVLSGEGIDDAFAKAGLQLPPLGAPMTSPLSPSRLELGDVGQYTDHRVMALGKTDVWVNGQVTPIAQLEAGPNFLGWTRAATPTAVTGATAPQPAQPGA